MKKKGNILWGIVFVVIGIIFGLNALEITNINIFFAGWWTLFIIVPCAIGLVNGNDKVGNLIGLLIGILLLLSFQRILSFSMIWKLIVPTILIIIGLSFIFKDMIGGKVNKEIKKLNETKAEQTEYCATFASQDINYEGEEFKGADLTAVFGGVKCNLRKAKITSDQVINATSIFGGIEIYVPLNVKVKIKSTPIFGGTSDKSLHSNNESDPTIYINSTCVFGGVNIK